MRVYEALDFRMENIYFIDYLHKITLTYNAHIPIVTAAGEVSLLIETMPQITAAVPRPNSIIPVVNQRQEYSLEYCFGEPQMNSVVEVRGGSLNSKGINNKI